MGQTDTAPSDGKPSLFSVMPDVVAGLKDTPALLFGIGAGIVLVAVLGVTQDVWLVVVVAVVLVAALAAWLVKDARGRAGKGGIKNNVKFKNSVVTNSNLGTNVTFGGQEPDREPR